jgi:acetyl esterase/lipase
VALTADAQDLKDVAYAGTSPSQRLDLYLPRRTGTAVPLVIDVHGGAFSEGDKADTDVLANVQPLRDAGFAVASVNYRLSGEARFPAALQDVKAAVRWLRANAATYGIDPQRIAIWGSSAGGYLATMAGVTSGQQNQVLDDASLGNPGVSSAVQAVVDWFGPTDLRAMDRQLGEAGCGPEARTHDAAGSPESRWLGAPVQQSGMAAASNPMAWIPAAPPRSLPPFLIVHGSADCTVPAGQSRDLKAALTAAGATADLTLVEGAGHGDRAVTTDQVEAGVAFLRRHLAAAPPAPGTTTPAATVSTARPGPTSSAPVLMTASPIARADPAAQDTAAQDTAAQDTATEPARDAGREEGDDEDEDDS